MSLCRDSLERLCHEAQALSEGGRGAGGEARTAGQLQTQHQTLLKRLREELRSRQLSLQEHQAFEETLRSAWVWLRGVQERVSDLDCTTGSKGALEKRLALVQVGKPTDVWSLQVNLVRKVTPRPGPCGFYTGHPAAEG